MKTRWVPLIAGALFASGLVVSGMTQSAKIVAFLDFSGDWDPSLLFVMMGAVAVYAAVFRGVVVKRARPLFGERFWIPAGSQIDRSLIVGAGIFGIGWGLSGFCPGPSLVAAGAGVESALWFLPAVLVGMLLHAWTAGKQPGGADG